MKYTSWHFLYASVALLTLGACSQENDPVDFPDAAAGVELGVKAGVAITKSAIIGGVQSGNAATALQQIAVRVAGNSTSYGSTNDYAVYKQNGSGVWATEASATNKIMLTSEEATVYAYHPAYTYDANGNQSTALTVVGTVGTDAVVSFSLFEGGSGSSGAPTQKANSTIPDDGSWASGKIFSAPGDIDYMWENTHPKASNGKASGVTSTSSVALTMNHALALVSFAVAKDATYTNSGKLTKIVLRNKSGDVLKAGTASLNIQDGTVTLTSGKAGTFTRFIKDDNGVAIPLSTAGAIPQYSLLVFPGSGARNTIEAVFTIDGADYDVLLAKDATAVPWTAGNNYVYNVTLSGKEMSLTSVTVQNWTAATGGSLDIN